MGLGPSSADSTTRCRESPMGNGDGFSILLANYLDLFFLKKSLRFQVTSFAKNVFLYVTDRIGSIFY